MSPDLKRLLILGCGLFVVFIGVMILVEAGFVMDDLDKWIAGVFIVGGAGLGLTQV